MPRAVAFYISGHGFGHAVRQISIINALREVAADVPVVVRTTAPAWLFERTARPDLQLIHGDTDTGVVQIDSLRPDERETIVRARAFQDDLPRRIQDEVTLLRKTDAGLVVADAPWLACSAAVEAGIESVVCSNFTWDWIYRGYAEQPGARELSDEIGSAYAAATAAWRLPMHGGFETFPGIVDVPFVARHGRAPGGRESVRERLQLPQDRRLALVSFGGFGLRQLPLDRLDCLDGWEVVVTSAGADDTPLPRGVHNVREDRMYGGGLRYEDLVGAVDAVITKPGYGIISDCIANRTAMLYTPRGRFAEYDVLVQEMPRYLRCRPLTLEAFEAGRWRLELDELAKSPPPPEQPRTDGAYVVARMISERLSAL